MNQSSPITNTGYIPNHEHRLQQRLPITNTGYSNVCLSNANINNSSCRQQSAYNDGSASAGILGVNAVLVAFRNVCFASCKA